MTIPAFVPDEERELLVVYPTLDAAQAAREALVRAGVPAGEIALDEEPDVVAALRAEMHEEMAEAWIVPTAAAGYTKRSAQGLLAGGVVGSVIGLVLAVVVAIPDYASTYTTRLLVCALVGLAFGATIGLVAGAALGSERPGRLPAAARGHLLRVSQDTPQLRKVLADLGPIRMDEVTHGGDPLDTVATEGPDDLAGDAQEGLRDIASRVPSDDYTPERDPESDHRHQEPRRSSRR